MNAGLQFEQPDCLQTAALLRQDSLLAAAACAGLGLLAASALAMLRWGERFGGEGVGSHCLITYPMTEGVKYTMRVAMSSDQRRMTGFITGHK